MPTDAIRPSDTAAPPELDPVTPPSRCGAILTIRHGKPNVSRRVMLNAAEYAAWWAAYEQTGLKPGQAPPPELANEVAGAVRVLSSTRIRAVETARAVVGEGAFTLDPSLIEAPLPPPRWPNWLRLPPNVWGVVARFWWWYFNHHQGQESRAAAEARAQEVARRLSQLAETGDVVIVAHGFFNALIRRYLRRAGWNMVESRGGFGYWCSRRLTR